MPDKQTAASPMRLISSTADPNRCELDEATGDELVRLIDQAAASARYNTLRESYCLDEIGQKEVHVALVRYVDLDGTERFAVFSHDPANAEYSDSTDRAMAEAAYEAEVRNLADCAGRGEIWWEHTDVDGVPESGGEKNEDDEE